MPSDEQVERVRVAHQAKRAVRGPEPEVDRLPLIEHALRACEECATSDAAEHGVCIGCGEDDASAVVDYVPAEQLRGAVEALREIRERTDREYDDEMIEDVVTIVDGVLYPGTGPAPLGGQ